MKRMICLLTAIVLCLSLAAPVFAADGGFVPSITYKENPEIVTIPGQAGQEYIGVVRDKDGNVLDYVGHGCLLITPIAHIWDEEKEVPANVEKLLTFVYEELNEGEMQIPYEKFEAEEGNDWEPIVKTVNNGDGTVTCTFEHLCAISFSMPIVPAAPPAEPHQPNILPWIILLIVVVVAIVVILIIKNKKKAAV